MERDNDRMTSNRRRFSKKRPRSTAAYENEDWIVTAQGTIDRRDPRGPVGDAIRFDDDVEILVGDGANGGTLILPRAIVTASSPVLKEMFLDEAWMSKGELVNEGVDEFNLYLNWLHSGVVATKKPADGQVDDAIKNSEDETDNRQPDTEFVVLTKLYILGKHLEDQNFMDGVIDAFLGNVRELDDLPADDPNRLPGPECIELIYKETAAKDQLKKLLIEFWTTDTCDILVEKKWPLELFRIEFRNDLLRKMMRDGTEMDMITSGGNCRFHAHSRDEPCGESGRRKRRRLA